MVIKGSISVVEKRKRNCFKITLNAPSHKVSQKIYDDLKNKNLKNVQRTNTKRDYKSDDQSKALLDFWNITAEMAPHYLEVPYKEGVIPDPIMSEIILFMKIKDFRVSTDSIIKCFNEMDTTNFKGVVEEELKKVLSPVQQQEIIWDLVNTLQSSGNDSSELILYLCNRINDDKLPFFGKAKSLSTHLTFGGMFRDDLERNAAYKKSFCGLLMACSNKDAQATLNTFLRSFISVRRKNDYRFS